MKKAIALLLIMSMLASMCGFTALAAESDTASLKADKAYIILAPDSFSDTGNWTITSNTDAGGYVTDYLKGNYSADEAFQKPATRKVVIPTDDQYYIWALSREYDSYVGARFFDVKIGDAPTQRLGVHGVNGWAWEVSDALALFSGEYDLKVADANESIARLGMIIVTNDPDFVPANTESGYKALQSKLYKDGMYTVAEKSTKPDADRPDSEIAVKLNGKYMTFDVDPILLNDRTMVPFRAIFEALGCTVDWNDETETAKGTRNGMTIRLPIGSKNVNVNGQSVTLDQPAVLLNDRTLVPLRFVSEALGAAVDWNDATQTVTIMATIPEAVYWLRPSTFADTGTWKINPSESAAFSSTVLQGINPPGAGATIADAQPELATPATATIQIAEAGEYYVWARVKDFSTNQPGTRYCNISVNGTMLDQKFGTHGADGYKWQKAPQKVTLNKGENTIQLLDTSGFYARFDSLLFCQNDEFVPPESETAMLAIAAPLSSGSDDIVDFPRYATELGTSTESVAIENSKTKVIFHKVQTSKGQVVQNEIYALDDSGNWVCTKTRDEDLGFFVAKADTASFKRTQDMATYSTTYTKNGKTYSYSGYNPYATGNGAWFVPTDYTVDGNTVTLIFADSENAKLTATWTVEENNPAPLVSATMTALSEGYYTMAGWEGGEFGDSEYTDAVAPYRVLKKRVHEEIGTLVEQYLFTPMGCYTLTENNKYGNQPVTKGVVANPDWIPGRWVHEDDSLFGINLKTPDGNYKGAIFAPLMGIDESKLAANQTYNLQYRVISSVSDWFSNYKFVAQDLFNVHDYRKNAYYSLNDAIFNTRELILDDMYAGWSENWKGYYNIEAITTVTNANPMQAVQDYLLSEDEEMLERRTIPTLASFLTRPGLQFNPGLIGYGSTTGWVKAPKEPDTIGTPTTGYNANVVGGLYEMTGGNVPYLYDLSLDRGQGNVANAYGNIAPFVNNLNMYIYTGQQSYLDTATKQADAYLEEVVYSDKGIMSKMPDWINFIYHGGYYPNFSSLLDIYEVTGEQKYLDAAEYVAEMILTALWVPGIQGDRATEELVVNDLTKHWYRDITGKDYKLSNGMHWYGEGEDVFRVGYDLETDPYGEQSKAKIQPENVERWIVERVGLGLEQSSTFENGSCNITMNYWAGDFMRLAQYTGEEMFSNAGRNAIIGRFGTYSGYYATDYATLQIKEEYPFEGPDITGIYYHHLPPFLAMLEDFLFGQVQLWSDNNILFPSLREQGYAYFSSKQFGHKPGKFFDQTDMWPWLAENTVDSGNLQIDWLAARKDGMMGIALMNESDEAVTTTVSLLEDVPGGATYTGPATVFEKDGSKSEISVTNGKFEITIPGKTLRAVTIAIPEVKAPAFAANSYTLNGIYELGATVTNHVDGRGYVLQISPENYYTYVYVTSVPKEASGLEMTYTVDNKTETVTTTTYPYEFITKVDDPNQAFTYSLTLLGADGTRTDMGTCTLMTRALSEKNGVKYTGEMPKTKPSKTGVTVEYKGSKKSFEPFDFAYERQGATGDGNFRFIVKADNITAISVTEKELVGLPVAGDFTDSGMTKQIITVITGMDYNTDGDLAIKVADVPGVSSSIYTNSASGNYRFNLKVYPYGTDVEKVLEEAAEAKNAALNVTYSGSGKQFEPVEFVYDRQGQADGLFRFVVPASTVEAISTDNKELIGLPIYGKVLDKGSMVDFNSVISNVEPRDSGYIVSVPETKLANTSTYNNSATGSYTFDLKIYPYGTDTSKIVYEGKAPEAGSEDSSTAASSEYTGSGKQFEPVPVSYSRQGYSDTNFRFIVPKSSLDAIGATAKELVGLTVSGNHIEGNKVTPFTSVITAFEDRGSDVLLIVPETADIKTWDYYDSTAKDYKFDLKIYPFEEK